MPDTETKCTTCEGSGLSDYASNMFKQWDGRAPFLPEQNGMPNHTPDMPHIKEACRPGLGIYTAMTMNKEEANSYFRARGTEIAMQVNRQLRFNLNEDDLRVLLKIRPTDSIMDPEDANAWHVINAYTGKQTLDTVHAYWLIQARCERNEQPMTCQTCNGAGRVREQ